MSESFERTDIAQVEGAAPMDPIDIGQRASSVADVELALDAVAADLRSLWSSALERRDFDEVTRIVEASHAVHRAVVALMVDNVISER